MTTPGRWVGTPSQDCPPSHQPTILVVNTDATAAALEALLTSAGYTVVIAASGRQALAALARSRVDAIMLDAVLPDGSGHMLCQRLRRMGVHQPILVRATEATADEVVAGLRQGADDHIATSAAAEEVLARLHALRRRACWRQARSQRPRAGS